MPPLPNRDQLDAQYARLVQKLLSAYGGRLLEQLGDPPSLNNILPEFWDKEATLWVQALGPTGERVYLEAAQQMMASGLPIGVDWGLVNQGAIDWARQYTFELVKGLQDTDRKMLQSAISGYFEQEQTIGELQKQIMRSFSPVRAEMIAVTEVTRASSEGEQKVARELEKMGIRMIPIWNTSNDELVCPLCAPRNGKEIKDGVFPPAHPRCRCTVGYRLPEIPKG